MGLKCPIFAFSCILFAETSEVEDQSVQYSLLYIGYCASIVGYANMLTTVRVKRVTLPQSTAYALF